VIFGGKNRSIFGDVPSFPPFYTQAPRESGKEDVEDEGPGPDVATWCQYLQ